MTTALRHHRSNRRLFTLTLTTVLVVASWPYGHAAQNDCGQPISNGATPTASDALFVLGAAVGLQTCEACVCDTNASGTITAADALVTLSVAVGLAGTMLSCDPCTGSQTLDCVREGYPCSLADADPDALDIAVNLLPQIWDVRAAGTMEDAKTFLATHPDVTDVVGNNVLIRFMVDGMMPVFFHDRTVVTQKPASDISVVSSSARTPTPSTPPRSVVGEDSTGDGKVDNHDIKRALVLAPYEFQFAPHDESVQIAERLTSMDAYAGNVVLKRNPSVNDRNIVLEDFLSFGNYDAVFISTHGSRVCDILPDLSNRCAVVISTRIEWDTQDRPQLSVTGLALDGYFDPEENQSRTQIETALTIDFWRAFYGGTLEKQLVSFSACETGNFEGGEIARAMGGDNFVMMGWTEVTDSGDAFAAAEVFTEELFKGRTADQARDKVEELGIIPYINSEGFQTTFEHFAPKGDDVRIIEIPRFIHDGGTMPDGTNIKESVTGTIGDAAPDSLELTVQIDGITDDTKSDFDVRYRVDDKDVPGIYALSSATLVPGYEYRYEVVHDVALGFPLSSGELPLEVIVDLPEGGESRFSVDAALASCSFSARVGGDKSGAFAGPAQFEIGMDGAITFTFSSTGWITQDGSNSVQAGIATSPGNPLVPGTYEIAQAGVSFADPIYHAQYLPGVSIYECDSCGGSITLDAVDENNISGSATVTMVHALPPPNQNKKPTVTMTVDFIAAFGSALLGSSPFSQCRIEYSDE